MSPPSRTATAEIVIAPSRPDDGRGIAFADRQPLPAQTQELLTGLRSKDALFVVTSDQRIVHWSSEAERLLGYRAADVIGKRCYQLVAGKDSFDFRFCHRDCPVIRNARRGRPSESFDLRARGCRPAEGWFNVSILLLPGPSPARPLIAHLVRDITDQRHLEERVHQVLQAVRGMVAEASAEASAPRSLVQPQKLTRREREVLRLIVCGLSGHEIARTLAISPLTARNHISNIQRKLGATNRLQIVLNASERDLI